MDHVHLQSTRNPTGDFAEDDVLLAVALLLLDDADKRSGTLVK